MYKWIITYYDSNTTCKDQYIVMLTEEAGLGLGWPPTEGEAKVQLNVKSCL